VTSTVDDDAGELARMAALWPAVVDQLREAGSELLSHVIEVARPVAIYAERSVLELGFPASAAFNKRKAETRENKELIAEAVQVVFGRALRPVYLMLDGEDDSEPGGENGAQALSEEELIERLKAEFDAEELDDPVEPGDPGEEAPR
jgi:hypothetical protein